MFVFVRRLVRNVSMHFCYDIFCLFFLRCFRQFFKRLLISLSDNLLDLSDK